ncbi:hypothetical protein KAI87_04255 [Myxococcota bacterium]|nr:hypothetical protein [Myxococcota bacterium]
MKNFLLLTLLVSLSTACSWEGAEQIDQAVWSDDDTAQAYVKLLYYERKDPNPLSGTTQKKDFRHQIFIQDADGSNRRALTDGRTFQNGAMLYYMKRAGYVVMEVIEGRDLFRYDIIRMDGQSTTLASWQNPSVPCAGFELTPSPDGAMIATMERLTAGQAMDLSCAPATVEVKFYSADSLSLISTYSWPANGMMESTWTLGGDFIVHDHEGGDWIVAPSTGPTPTTPPGCVYPKTTSGSVSAAGVVLSPGDSDSDPVHSVTRPDVTVFGCQ